MQSVKYPAEGLCHSSIAQEEANARVLEKKPQEAVGTNGKTVTVDHNKRLWEQMGKQSQLIITSTKYSMQLSKLEKAQSLLHGMLQEHCQHE